MPSSHSEQSAKPSALVPPKKRAPPNSAPPYSALDTAQIYACLEALDEPLKNTDLHVSEFQRRLHKAKYPDLADFPWDDFPKKFANVLSTSFVTRTSTVTLVQTSSDGSTTKLLVQLHDGHMVESVIMRHDTGRTTLCVSSQVGCQMGCTFCATGTMGIIGDLSAGEILEQLVHAMDVAPIRNIVFMGMGEPLNNFINVKAAVTAMINTKQFGLAHGHVTVSTVGITPKIRQLSKELPFVNLALSLHAPNQEMRSKIVPAAKAYKIEGLIEALDDHMRVSRSGDKLSGDGTSEAAVSKNKQKDRKAMIQYTMLNGPTASFECAHQLGALCEGKNIIVNLIPYNQTDVKDKYSCPSLEHIEEFQRIVRSYGLFVFIRKTMGEDIAGACGQLVLDKRSSGEEKKGGDIEDILEARSQSPSGGGESAAEVKKRGGKPAPRPAVPQASLAAGVGGEGGEEKSDGTGRAASNSRDKTLLLAGLAVSVTLGAALLGLGVMKALGKPRRIN
jgi:sorting nexin-8